MSKAAARKVKTTRGAKVLSLASSRPAAAPAPAPTGVQIGTLVRCDADGVYVDYPANPGEPVLARVAVALAPEPSAVNALAGQSVVLLFDGVGAPVILGLLQPLAPAKSKRDVEVKVDGKRMEFEAQEEIVLKCGKSSIVLRSNGRVEIRGVRVETRAKGVNRIKGGSVAIN